jgi:hypothetical protein
MKRNWNNYILNYNITYKMDHLKPKSLDKEYYNYYNFINLNIKCITESNENYKNKQWIKLNNEMEVGQ